MLLIWFLYLYKLSLATLLLLLNGKKKKKKTEAQARAHFDVTVQPDPKCVNGKKTDLPPIGWRRITIKPLHADC